MMGWFESIQFNLFCHHCFHGNTVHCLCIRICWRLWYFLYALFQMSCVFSSVECDVLIGVIWCENIHRCFSFNVVYAIYNVYVGIFPLCWILIADEVCCMSFDSVAFDLWYVVYLMKNMAAPESKSFVAFACMYYYCWTIHDECHCYLVTWR